MRSLLTGILAASLLSSSALAQVSTLSNPPTSVSASALPAFTGDVTTSAGSSVTSLSSATVVSKVSGQALAPASVAATGVVSSSGATSGVGYATGAGGAVTQITSRVTGVTLNKACGAITLFSVAGSATSSAFTVTDSAVAATDVVIVNQKSGTDKYILSVTTLAAGSFQISSQTTGGVTVESPVFQFCVIKGVNA